MDSERRNFFKKEIANLSSKKSRKKEEGSGTVQREKSVERRDSDVISGSQSYNTQNKDSSTLTSKHAKKTVCKKLFTAEATLEIPIHKENEGKKDSELIGSISSDSEIVDRSKLISSKIVIEIERDGVEAEKVSPAQDNEKSSAIVEENSKPEEQKDKNESTVHQSQKDKNNGKSIHCKLVNTDNEPTTNEDNNMESEICELNLQSTLTEIIPEKEMDMIRKSLDEDVDMYQYSNNQVSISPEVKKKRKKSARKAINKSYVDFLSEEEDFVWDSSSWKETGDDSDSSSTKTDGPKKKRKKVISEDGKVGDAGLKKKKINTKKLRNELRQKGKSYVKKDGTIVNEKGLKPNPCLGKKCGHNCGEINEEKRKNVFNYYWQLSPQGKKDWIVAMSSSQEVKRKRCKSSAYRSRTYNYFINDGEGRRQVCLKFILSTLDISQKYVQYTISTASYGIAKEESRGKFTPSNKTSEENKDSARNWIKNLPALPSHYCRKDSTRLYLPVEFKNIKNLYRIYRETKSSEGVDCISEKLFRNIFLNEFNLGFHIPKKDKCLKCLTFESENENDCPEKKAHLEEKKASKARLECHRELVKENSSILCTSFDLQKVLNTPHGSNMQLYYSRKYAVYNLCFYENGTRSGFCYIWGESEGNRGANEIATILQKYIRDVDARESIKTLILYSDSCPGQNKNKIVLAALHNALLQSQNLETIQMNYLLPGHTEMSVDSIHSTIENSVRNTTVWAPSQWLTICQVARKDPRPYHVEGLMHEDFMSYDDLADKYFKGNLIGKISKLRIATFKKSAPNIMKVKYSMKEESPEEKIQIVAKPKPINQRYTSSLPITKVKYRDLKKLCDSSVIPRIFHSEYLSLKSSDGNDELIDTDIEDEVDLE